MRTVILIIMLALTINSSAQISELKSPSTRIFCTSFDVSPDGKYIAIIGDHVKLLDVKSGKELRVFNFRSSSVSFAPDGKSIAIDCESGIKIIDISTGEILKSIEDTLGICSVQFSPIESTIAYFAGKFLKILNLESGKKWNLETGKNSHSYGPHYDKLKFTKDGKYIVTSDSDLKGEGNRSAFLNIWDVKTGIEVKSFANNRYIHDFDISPDGSEIVSVHGRNDSLKFWDFNNGKLKKVINLNLKPSDSIPSWAQDIYISVCYTPDGKKVLTGQDISKYSSIKLWDIETGKFITSFNDGKYGLVVNSILFSPNTNNFITNSANTNGEVKIWDIITKKVVQNFERKAKRIEEFKITESGDRFLTKVERGNFGLLDNSLKNIITFDSSSFNLRLMSFPANSDTIISITGENVYFWDFNNGKVIKKYEKLLSNNSGKFISQDGRYLIESNSGIKLPDVKYEAGCSYKYYDLTKGSLLGYKLIGDNGGASIKSMCFSPDNKYFAAGMSKSTDESLKFGKLIVGIWETSTGKQVTTFPTKYPDGVIEHICFSNDGRYIFTAHNNEEEICQWDLTGNLIKTFKGNYPSLSKNGKYLLSNSYKEHETFLYDIETGMVKQKFANNDHVFGNTYISDDCKLVYLSKGDCLQIWDVATGKLLFSKYLIGETDWVTITPDGLFDGSPEGLKELYYVNGLTIIPLESTFEQFYSPNLAQRIIAGEKIQNSINLSQLKPAPEVKIVSPKKNTELSNSNLIISVQVKDNGGGIDEIQLFHNGKLVETTHRGFKSISTDNTQNFSVTLIDGLNTFKATAFNLQRTESVPDIIQLNYSGQKAASNLYLLVIGVNNYKNPKNKLNYALADAGAFKTAIENGSKEIFGSINATFLQDSEASKQEIINAFKSIKEKVKPEDVFIFYYAGHGVMSEEAKSKFYLVPFDVIQLYGDNESLKTLAISSEELQDISREIKAQKQLYILDACQSGGMVELLASRGSAEQKAIAQLSRSTGTYWLTASNSSQFATEFSTLGHGLFTYTLLQGLSGNADGGTMDKKITVEELSAYIKNTLPELSTKYKGEAQYPNSFGYGNDFPIVVIKK